VQLTFELVVHFIYLSLEVSRKPSRCGVESLKIAELIKIRSTDLFHDIIRKLRKTFILLLFIFASFAFISIVDARNKSICGTIWFNIARSSCRDWDWGQLLRW
jgi:hypothetical protein